ncbi:hypothetical protein HDU76_011339 [Blyttiomyces sp. JEL0837]|nr:hypothetical protein HDU76_011339 [Blyttiomyces sp. JEL0837]
MFQAWRGSHLLFRPCQITNYRPSLFSLRPDSIFAKRIQLTTVNSKLNVCSTTAKASRPQTLSWSGRFKIQMPLVWSRLGLGLALIQGKLPQFGQLPLITRRFFNRLASRRQKGTLSQFKRSPRRFFNRYLDENTVLYGIIGVNTAGNVTFANWPASLITYALIHFSVFGLWQYAMMRYNRGDSSWLSFMERNFYCSWNGVEDGKWWTILSSTFSHNTLIHFGLNMFVFWNFGPIAISIIGAPQFLLFYLGAGIASSAAHLVYSRYIQPALRKRPIPRFFGRPIYSNSHGASGAIYAATLLYALSYPWSRITLFFFFDVPAIAGVGLFVAYDLYLAYGGNHGRVDSAGHLGGALYGALYWLLRIRR